VARVEPFRQALLTDDGSARVAAAAETPSPRQITAHSVRRGETLSMIARRYGVETNDIRQANNLRGSVIQPGQVLVIPRSGLTAAVPPGGTLVAESRPEIAAQLPERQPAATQAAKPKPSVHVVKPGDTLYGLARRYGVSIPALSAANGLSSKSHLTAGDRLEIPGRGKSSASGSASATESTRMTYKVRSGDTLSEIADKFNVSVSQLMSWNRMRQSTSLRTGQKLVVYADPRRVNGG
jgi:membrane-bound lytic murein transglycosylase D